MRLSASSIGILVLLNLWFGMNFVGVQGVVAAEPLASLAGLNLAVMAVCMLAGAAGIRYAAILTVAALSIWAFLQIETHWWGYAFGASPGKIAWHARVWGENWQLLPHPGAGRLRPDGYHTVLFALIVTAWLSVAGDVIRRPGEPPAALRG